MRRITGIWMKAGGASICAGSTVGLGATVSVAVVLAKAREIGAPVLAPLFAMLQIVSSLTPLRQVHNLQAENIFAFSSHFFSIPVIFIWQQLEVAYGYSKGTHC